MEIGSLAEWATAVAETAAVLVALFLPYLERRRNDRKNSRNLKIMLRGIIERALKDQNSHSLESFLNLSSLTDAGERDKETLDTARQILELFQTTEMNVSERHEEIIELLSTIQP
ncbi:MULTISPECIES: hypothetical protein [unclassified Bifidobacterium]|uniref:hypothetical protein n=1 Tax=unclassified Bifidobacterium TaxID=2608897 RepID=UPI0023FA0827|nr:MULTISPECIES: hypothetical protein [unclassified Bifidobacterium]WEV65156.1 hypothetical protein OZX71_05075 [Bifidobacterium sp. ESL0764]WEV76024.1 hypothetical protein OZX75_02185 [Bifidobacterium sp. ESL0800]